VNIYKRYIFFIGEEKECHVLIVGNLQEKNESDLFCFEFISLSDLTNSIKFW